MARLMLIGEVAEVKLTSDPEDGRVVAECWTHTLAPVPPCDWTERYDNMGDATEYAAGHADRGAR